MGNGRRTAMASDAAGTADRSQNQLRDRRHSRRPPDTGSFQPCTAMLTESCHDWIRLPNLSTDKERGGNRCRWAGPGRRRLLVARRPPSSDRTSTLPSPPRLEKANSLCPYTKMALLERRQASGWPHGPRHQLPLRPHVVSVAVVCPWRHTTAFRSTAEPPTDAPSKARFTEPPGPPANPRTPVPSRSCSAG